MALLNDDKASFRLAAPRTLSRTSISLRCPSPLTPSGISRKGEQIFYSYTDIYQPAVVRQQNVSKYGFRCTCKACTGDTSEIDKFRATYIKALAKLLVYQQNFL